jgi:hypothetical protein
MPGFPHGSVAPQIAAESGQDMTPMAVHTERAGRAIVNRILGTSLPHLREIRQLMRDHRLQLEATGEHRQIMSNQDFMREVLAFIRRQSPALRDGDRRVNVTHSFGGNAAARGTSTPARRY